MSLSIHEETADGRQQTAEDVIELRSIKILLPSDDTIANSLPPSAVCRLLSLKSGTSVSLISELFPLPLTPVTHTNLCRGNDTVTFLRLCVVMFSSVKHVPSPAGRGLG